MSLIPFQKRLFYFDQGSLSIIDILRAGKIREISDREGPGPNKFEKSRTGPEPKINFEFKDGLYSKKLVAMPSQEKFSNSGPDQDQKWRFRTHVDRSQDHFENFWPIRPQTWSSGKSWCRYILTNFSSNLILPEFLSVRNSDRPIIVGLIVGAWRWVSVKMTNDLLSVLIIGPLIWPLIR